ncbi:MAG: DUF5667 domain-containing protein [Dehalococcoidales bacterium]
MEKGKEFDNILEECLERILTRGETIEQCLASYPEQATELEPLLQTALSTKETLAIKPRPEFRERAKYQLLAELREMEEKQPRRFSLFSWQPRWATAVIAVLILVLASGSTVAAASGSMPDQPLYPLKLATERVRLALTPSALGKAELYAKLADKRVTEIINMVDKGKLEQVERTTRRLNTQLVAMTSLVSPAEREPAALTVPSAAEEPQEKRPGMVPTPAPPVAEELPERKPEVRVAPAQPVPQEAPALQAPPAGAEADVDKGIETDRRAKLRMIVARNVSKHREALRSALKRAPESARPALLRAIAASDAEYEKILQALRQRVRNNQSRR